MSKNLRKMKKKWKILIVLFLILMIMVVVTYSILKVFDIDIIKIVLQKENAKASYPADDIDNETHRYYSDGSVGIHFSTSWQYDTSSTHWALCDDCGRRIRKFFG